MNQVIVQKGAAGKRFSWGGASTPVSRAINARTHARIESGGETIWVTDIFAFELLIKMSESFKTVRAGDYILSATTAERVPMPSLTIPARRTALLLHAVSGTGLAVFLVFHLANHALAFFDLEYAFTVMERLRIVYRWPPVETLLIACVVYQVASGLVLARRRSSSASDKTRWATLASGYYLLFFMTLHTAAVFLGRYIAGLDTNIYFAAAGLHAWQYSIFFFGYYFLGVVAIFVHLGQAIMNRGAVRDAANKRAGLASATATGVVVATIIMAAMAGSGNGMRIPAEYMSVYRN